MLLIFLDTETTGLNPEKHRTLEIAYRIFDSVTGKDLVRYEALISQPREIWAAADPSSIKIHGFTWENTLGYKTEKVVASEIANDLNHAGLVEKSGVFICQNPSFDRAFFSQLLNVDLQGQYHWPYHWLDLASMYWATRLLKDKTSVREMKESGLSKNNIAAHLGLPQEGLPHRAMNGVNHLIACYKALFGSHANLS